MIETVVGRLERSVGSDWSPLRGQIALAIGTPDYRGAVISLLDQLFLSSANLTKYAFSLNMELGVLITGGRAPHQIESLFECLMNDGILDKI